MNGGEITDFNGTYEEYRLWNATREKHAGRNCKRKEETLNKQLRKE